MEEAADGNFVEIIPLGAGSEVGRSCIILKFMGKTVMLDCGIHPGLSGFASIPYLDTADLALVDVALITHFHLDHCAAVPYLIGRTEFKGRVFMTHPTKAIFYMLLKDFVKVSKGSVDDQLFNDQHLDAAMERVEIIDFHQTLNIDGIKITAYRAGHVLGAAMFMVEVAGMRCLYTGDYSRLKDRHLDAADYPDEKPHVVIVESTYGVSNHLPREDREARFLELVRNIITRGGRVLLPVVALGRAQELLLMLEEYWERNSELQAVPIYQASGLARRAMTVYQTYIESMNLDIQGAFQMRNPFEFKHIQHLKSAAQFDDIGACVVMATPSMLQSGLSRELFDMWCEDSNNGVIIADFAVQGTLAREILGAPQQVMTKSGVKVPLKIQVEAISFSAHADFAQTSEFLDTLRPPHVVLVHGEATDMGRLRSALEQRATALGFERVVYTPKNCQPVLIAFKPENKAAAVGRLADKPPTHNRLVRGVLLEKAGDRSLVQPEDLPRFSKLYTGRVTHKQAVQTTQEFSELRLALEVMFEGVEGFGEVPVTGTNVSLKSRGSGQCLRVGNMITITHYPGSTAGSTAGGTESGTESGAEGGTDAPSVKGPYVVLEWEGGAVGDAVADAVVAVILQAASAPVEVTAAEEARRLALADGDIEGANIAEMQLVAAVLRAQFGPTELDLDIGTTTVMVGNTQAVVDHYHKKVTCDDEHVQKRVEKALMRVMDAMQPCSLEGPS